MSARFVHALSRMAWLADEVADVMRAVIVGPPSRAVVRRDFELPGPVELERGDVERIAGLTASLDAAVARAIATEGDAASALAAQHDRTIAGLSSRALPRGLVPCATCGTEQAPRDGRMAVHFPTREAVRPCPGSWPVKVVPR